MSTDRAQGHAPDEAAPVASARWRRWRHLALGAGAAALFGLAVLSLVAVLRFTAGTPASIPPSGLAPAESDDVQARWREFESREGAGRRATLTLNGPELHALLQSRFGLGDQFATRIVGDTIRVRMSLPIWVPGAGQRYLNLEGIARPQRKYGERLEVRLQELTSNGRRLPAMVARFVERRWDLVETLNLKVNGHDVRESLDDLSIHDGILTLATRPLPGESRRRRSDDGDGDGDRSRSSELPDPPFASEYPVRHATGRQEREP